MVAASYCACISGPDPQQVAFAARVAAAETRVADAQAVTSTVLAEACVQAELQLRPKLPKSCRTIVRSPFVIAGDRGDDELDRLYREAVSPITNALWRSYFDRRPDQPIVLVLLSDEAAYQAAAQRLDNYEPFAYAGYYQRSERRIVLNLATGYGTLAHELAHALAQFDFPEMPEWFDEGLAALYEETRFSDDDLLLIGTANWRCRLLPAALRNGELPTLHSVISTQSFRGEGEGLNYALVRSFCRYLQERGLLSHFYRKFRAARHDDPSGLKTLREVLGVTSSAAIDRNFRRWIVEQAALP